MWHLHESFCMHLPHCISMKQKQIYHSVTNLTLSFRHARDTEKQQLLLVLNGASIA
jgi:hypothetical protein